MRYKITVSPVNDTLSNEYIFGGARIRAFEQGMGPLKWNNWQIALLDLSKKYPDHTITLTRQGDEIGDLRRCFFLNGESHMAIARLPESIEHMNEMIDE